MSDRLKEALEELRVDFEHDRTHLRKHTKAAYAAARRLLEAEERGDRLWCETHEASTTPAGVCWAKLARRPRPESSSRCVLVPKLLLDPQEGDG